MRAAEFQNIGGIIDRAAAQWGDRPAIHDEFGTLSFAGLHAEVVRLAGRLTALGVARGTGLGLPMGNSRLFLIGLLAGLKSGAVVLPIWPRINAADLQDTVAQAGLHFLLTRADAPKPGGEDIAVIETGAMALLLSRMNIDLSRIIAPHIQNPAVIRFTSGTTGRAKGVVVSHHSVLERIVAANRGLGLGPGDTVLWLLPMAYHFIVSILLYIHFGVTIAVVEYNLGATAILAAAERHQATMIYASPFHIRLLGADASTEKMPSVQKVISTSAGLSAEICRKFYQRFGKHVCQALGVIEVGLPVLNFRSAEAHPEALGYVTPGYEVALLDGEFQPVPAGATGQLAIRGPGMFDGYLSPPLTRGEVLRDGWFLTGDLANRTQDGLISIKGRAISVINVAGTKVFPEEIEAVLMQHPELAQCRVYGRDDPLLGEYIAVQAVLRPGASANAGALLGWCRKRLSLHMLPRAIEIVADIPMTETGKIMRF